MSQWELFKIIYFLLIQKCVERILIFVCSLKCYITYSKRFIINKNLIILLFEISLKWLKNKNKFIYDLFYENEKNYENFFSNKI